MLILGCENEVEQETYKKEYMRAYIFFRFRQQATIETVVFVVTDKGNLSKFTLADLREGGIDFYFLV